MVGPKGATIKRIQQQTHTYIITPSRDKEPIFEVTGLPDNVETARSEIELHIASRTGSFSPSFDSKDASIMDEFHLNGTEIGFNGGGGGVEDCYVDSQVTAAAVKSLRSMSYSTTTVNSNNNVSAQSFGATSMNLLNSQVLLHGQFGISQSGIKVFLRCRYRMVATLGYRTRLAI